MTKRPGILRLFYRRGLARAARAAGCDLVSRDESAEPPYHQDGLRTIHSHEFLNQRAFVDAYTRGVTAAGADYRWHWRVHLGLWAAYSARVVAGDYVECGVNRGFLSSAIMRYLDWDTLGKTFYLFDTFCGPDESRLLPGERSAGLLATTRRLNAEGFYVMGADSVRRNFAEWKNVCIVEGPIPDALERLRAERIAFLHIDLNCAAPEAAALDRLWDRLTPGAFVLLDDYAYAGHREQYLALDAVAAARGARIASLPTGQGLLIKHP